MKCLFIINLILLIVLIINVESLTDAIEYNTLGRTFGPINLGCGAESRLKKITIINPAKLVNECVYTIRAYSTRVCQLRIDFDLILAQPIVNTSEKNYPHCFHDVFSVNGIELCGTNLGQHIYVPFDIEKLTDTIKLNFKIADRIQNPLLSSVLWSMTITQLECDEKTLISTHESLRAPHGCLQYFTEKTGNIESFNYNHGNGPYLGNMNYGICIKRNLEDKQLSIKSASFEMSKANPNNDGYDQDCFPQIKTPGGNEDYIAIPEAIRYNGNEIRASKYCGRSLEYSTIISTAPGPFIIYFNSDTQYDLNSTSQTTERGFRFSYGIS